jgi:hypothetical protein
MGKAACAIKKLVVLYYISVLTSNAIISEESAYAGVKDTHQVAIEMMQ